MYSVNAMTVDAAIYSIGGLWFMPFGFTVIPHCLHVYGFYSRNPTQQSRCLSHE